MSAFNAATGCEINAGELAFWWDGRRRRPASCWNQPGARRRNIAYTTPAYATNRPQDSGLRVAEQPLPGGPGRARGRAGAYSLHLGQACLDADANSAPALRRPGRGAVNRKTSIKIIMAGEPVGLPEQKQRQQPARRHQPRTGTRPEQPPARVLREARPRAGGLEARQDPHPRIAALLLVDRVRRPN